MDRPTAVALIARTIAAHRGITHLRLTVRGGIAAGSGRIEVTTLARPADGKRARGTYERTIVRESIRDSVWAQVFTTLEPKLGTSHGCAGSSGFDVDTAGTSTNRHGVTRTPRVPR